MRAGVWFVPCTQVPALVYAPLNQRFRSGYGPAQLPLGWSECANMSCIQVFALDSSVLCAFSRSCSHMPITSLVRVDCRLWSVGAFFRQSTAKFVNTTLVELWEMPEQDSWRYFLGPGHPNARALVCSAFVMVLLQAGGALKGLGACVC